MDKPLPRIVDGIQLPSLPFYDPSRATKATAAAITLPPIPPVPTSSSLGSASASASTSATTLTSLPGSVHPDQFTRSNVQTVIHLITQELKTNGTKTPHIFLPFRSKVSDSKLSKFLSLIAPQGIILQDSNSIAKICSESDEFTLISCLKYFWSRLPNNEIIGIDVYNEFKKRESERKFPKNAFLTIMPKCLKSQAHASIVHDFLDLILSLISNSQFNHLNGRKISMMASFWAFNTRSTTSSKEADFMEGIENWKSYSMALFHLVLSFLRSMLPEKNSEALQLPKSLQSILVATQYPPVEKENYRSITIPCLSVSTNKPSSNAYDLLGKVRKNLSFDKNDISKENYTILKNVFSKRTTNDIIDTFTEESKRVLARITAEQSTNEYGLRPGWAKPGRGKQEDLPLVSTVSIKNVTIQDFYVWTWLASLASDQPESVKSAFGRSIVMEASVLGFQKWVVVTEKMMDKRVYNKLSESQYMQTKLALTKTYKDLPLPPLPNEKNQSEEEEQQQRQDEDPSNISQITSSRSGDVIAVYEEMGSSIADDSSYIYPTSVTTEDVRKLESDMGKKLSLQYAKVIEDNQDNDHENHFGARGVPTRKAPPAGHHQSRGSQYSSKRGSSGDETFSRTNTVASSREELDFSAFDGKNVDSGPTIQQMGDFDQDKQRRKEEKKAKKHAEAAQLAAAQAAGFPYAVVPLNDNNDNNMVPPPSMQTIPYGNDTRVPHLDSPDTLKRMSNPVDVNVPSDSTKNLPLTSPVPTFMSPMTQYQDQSMFGFVASPTDSTRWTGHHRNSAHQYSSRTSYASMGSRESYVYHNPSASPERNRLSLPNSSQQGQHPLLNSNEGLNSRSEDAFASPPQKRSSAPSGQTSQPMSMHSQIPHPMMYQYNNPNQYMPTQQPMPMNFNPGEMTHQYYPQYSPTPQHGAAHFHPSPTPQHGATHYQFSRNHPHNMTPTKNGHDGPALNVAPIGVKHDKNKPTNKANLRQALINGDFGI
ncbi:uncharacterized protein LODBEIA_P30670 [Lodderomyces beijingensis]|uniref:Meiotically up-regulated protein Msb1/Mug8 domain-containing protein n=1 Tax=Lodderomyces beijingensis TaxID=1775926 RepID=A0ABP0ZL17_9ASCO